MRNICKLCGMLLGLGLFFSDNAMGKIDAYELGLSLERRQSELVSFKKEYDLHKNFEVTKNDLIFYKECDKEKCDWIIGRSLEERPDVIRYCLENNIYSFEWCINELYKKHMGQTLHRNESFDSIGSLECALAVTAFQHDKQSIQEKLQQHWIFGENKFKIFFHRRNTLSRMYDDFVLYKLDEIFGNPVHCDRFQRFLWNVVEYYTIMKYFSNFQAFDHYNCTDVLGKASQEIVSQGGIKTIAKYNLGVVPDCILFSGDKNTDYAQICLEKIITEYKHADVEKKQDFLNVARWCGHDLFLMRLHLNKKFSELKRLNNVTFNYM